MDFVKEIIQNSAIGLLPNGYKKLILSLFASIVILLLCMLVALVLKGAHMNIQFGY